MAITRTQQLCQHLVPPLNITITTNQLSSQNYRNGPGEENNSACAILNTSRKKQIYEASNEGSEAGPWTHTDAALMVSTWAQIPTCKLHPQHSAGLDTLSTSRPGVNPRGARRKTITGCSGLKYRSKMLIIPELKQASLDNSVNCMRFWIFVRLIVSSNASFSSSDVGLSAFSLDLGIVATLWIWFLILRTVYKARPRSYNAR